MKLQVEYVPIDTIKPYKRNAKLHPQEQIEQIKNSMKEFGNIDPIGVWHNEIVEGHGRYEALRQMGVKEVPVIRLDDLTDEQRKAYALAHNKLTMNSDFDVSLLDTELAEIETIDMTLLGFDDKKPAHIDVKDDDFDEDLPKEPNAKHGDIYKLGNHRLMCGDSTKIDDVEKLMGGCRADILVTSPPYNVGCNAVLREHREQGNNKNEIKSLYADSNDKVDWFELMHDFTENAKMVTMSQFINVQMLAINKHDFIEWLHENNENLVDLIVWDKHTCPPQIHENVLNNAYEFVVCLDNETATRLIRFGNFKGTFSNFIETKKEKNKFADVHKAVFSVEFVNKILEINSLCKSVVDLFGGTGTTMIACEQLGKQCYMMEMSPQYVDLIIDRWETFTGKKAELIGNYGNGKVAEES